MDTAGQILRTRQLPKTIDKIELHIVEIPFKKPFFISSYAWSTKRALLVEICSGGVSGWGECVADPDPYYSPETIASARYIIKEYILPQIKAGMQFTDFEAILNKIRGNRMARAAVENAILDLCAKLDDVPLYRFLGVRKKKIPSGISIGIQPNTDALIGEVQSAVDDKYHRIKLKIKNGYDVEVISAVRNIYPDIQLMADANGDYTLADISGLKSLDNYNLMMIEQPLGYDDIIQHAELQKNISTPVCLDESIHSLQDAKNAISLGSCKIINIKQGRVGGIAEALRIAEYCMKKNIPVWCGGMDETGFGRAFNLHLQTHPAFALPGDTSATSRYFEKDIVFPEVTLNAEGFIDIPSGSGIGVQPDMGYLAKVTLGTERIF